MTICCLKICLYVTISTTFLCSMINVDCAPAANKRSLDWRHLIGKRSTDKTTNTKDKIIPHEKSQKATEKLETVENRKSDDDIDEERERTVDWRLLGDSNDLSEEMAARRRRRSITLQTTNANRQRSRMANVNRNKYHQQQKERMLKNKNRYRVKRALYGDGDDAQQISETDLEKLAYLVSELQQLNEEERRLEGNDAADDDSVYPPSDEMYYYPQSSYHQYQSISPQVNADDLALLAQWWRAQQQKMNANSYVRKRSAYYAPSRYDAEDDGDDDIDNDVDDFDRSAVPVQVVLLDPSMLDDGVDDDEDEDDDVENRYAGYPIVVPNESIESTYPFQDRSNPTYYAYDVDDATNRRSDEIELEKRIASLARYLNRRSTRR